MAGDSPVVSLRQEERREQEAPNINSDVLLVLCRLGSTDIEVVGGNRQGREGGGVETKNGATLPPSKVARAPPKYLLKDMNRWCVVVLSRWRPEKDM